MNGFERRRKEKTDAILRAALVLFSARGVKDVSVAEIAAKAHVSPVTIYNYFGSKDNLAKQVFFALMDQKMAEAERLFTSDLSFREKLESLFRFEIEAASEPTMDLVQHAYPADPDVQRLVEEYYRTKTIPLITNLIEQGKREGAVPSSLSTEAVLLYMEIFRRALARPDFYSTLSKKVSLDLIALFFYGLQGQPPAD
ncbi:MAG TPA: TetR/AcrR family transcriptional regulator [Firmicutes bacterium]|nr:TetR/AcrR family transcriptional regulator [Bacillota bacterium]